jgi:hypothetical protein
LVVKISHYDHSDDPDGYASSDYEIFKCCNS